MKTNWLKNNLHDALKSVVSRPQWMKVGIHKIAQEHAERTINNHVHQENFSGNQRITGNRKKT